MEVQVSLVKVFTKNRRAGNPTGVVRDADQLSDAHILKITKELGFAESAFLQKSSRVAVDYKIRLFSV